MWSAAPSNPPVSPSGSEVGQDVQTWRSLTALRFGLLTLNLLGALLCAIMLRSELKAETTLSEQQTANTAELLARGAAAMLDKARLEVDSVADRLEAEMAGPGVQRTGIWPTVDRAVGRVPELQTIGLFDHAGAQICGLPTERCRGLKVADRDYFIHYRDAPASDPALFGPVSSRLDGDPVLILARALRSSDGRFAGLAIGLLPLKAFEAIVATASLGPHGVASLRMAQPMTLLARAPVLPNGQDASHMAAISEVMRDHMQRAPLAGLFSAVSSVDGATRINAYQRLPGYPVYALVGDAVVDSQAAWRSMLTWTCGFLFMFAAASFVIERALTRSRRSEQRARALFNEAPCGYHTLDGQGRFIDVNATGLSWLGRPRQAVVGQARATDFLTDEGRATFAREFPRLLAGETLCGLEYDLVGGDGQRRRVSVDASPVFDVHGRFVSTNSVMHDISALHEARQALQQQNARQQLLLDNRLVGIARVKNRRFVWVNAAFESLFGYRPAELIDRETTILYPNQAAFEAMGAAAAARLSHSGVFRDTVELRRKDGTAVWADCSGTMLTDGSGEVLWISKDVTDVHRAEALRLEAAGLAAENRQLQETARLHTMFLANMSHELRTPLNAVIGLSDLLKLPRVMQDTDKRTRYVNQIGASGTRLLAMIDSLLDLAKLEAGRMPLHPEPVDPVTAIQEVLNMMEPRALERSVTLRCVSGDLPVVRLDPLRLKQVLLNYVSNAIKFSKAGSEVLVAASMPGPACLRIEVHDEGIGIAQADQARLFVRFEQLSAGTTKAYEGTGIGLALVKQIMEVQGGRVGVHSSLGRGSVFWAEWPVEI